jgi:predicted DCC family thiol-disulfide oxidoreductase YuxK
VSPVILFDGVCNLCNGSVQFMIARDPHEHFRFASIQSDAGEKLMREHGIEPPKGDPSSIMLIEDGKAYERSTAALRIVRHLRFPWNLAWVFVIVPRPLRDVVYKFIASHRYKWFGKKDVCMVPTPELRARFL